MVAVQKTEYEVDFDIHYLCKKNFLLDGPQKVTCLSNGSWTASPPYCRGEGDLTTTNTICACNEFTTDKRNICTGVLTLLMVFSARCLIPAERSRVVISGVKRWPFDVTDAMVSHGENVTFYCKHPHKQCSFTADQTCFDGKLQPPTCYLGKPGPLSRQ